MSLILRNNLTRPLTHDELDGNLVYLNIAEWVKKGYLEGQYVLVKTGAIGIIYYCEMTHTDFIYNQYGSGNFVETYVDGTIVRRVWRQIGTSGGSGGYVTIQKDGIPLIQRSVLNFSGDGVNITDDPVNGRTIVTINASGGGQITGGSTTAGLGGTTNIIQTLDEIGGGTIVIDLVPAFTFENPNPVKQTVGGIELGTSPFVGGKTIHQIIQEIFYPAINPTIFYSSVSLNRTNPFNNELIEIGFIGDLVLNANFIKGESNVNNQPTKFMGDPIQYDYSGQGIIGVITNMTSNLTDNITLTQYTVVQGLNQWIVASEYLSGEQPVLDTGDIFNDVTFTSPGSVSANTVFEGVYPIFATTLNINTLSKIPLVSMINGNNIEIDLVAEPEDDSDKHKFEIPIAWTNNRPLIAVNYFNTVINQFDTTNKINEFSTSFVTNTIQNDSVSYTRYTHTGLATGSRKIRLVF